MRFFDQPFAYSAPLILLVDREIGEIAAVRKVGDSPRNADELSGVASGDDKIGLPQHSVQPDQIMSRPPFGKRRRYEYFPEFLG